MTCSRLDDFIADGVDDEFGDGVESEFEHDVGAMSFGGVDADAEEGGDFLVAFALGEELQDFAFARSEAEREDLGGSEESAESVAGETRVEKYGL
jgi:hypothetical protein